MPAQSPATYGILGLSCLFFVISLLATIRVTGFTSHGGGGLSGLFNFGGISGGVLERFGASLPLPYNLAQPWRFVMAIFLHGSILHIFFNMWVLMDIGP
ncbi:MAG TPA: rhomboid family intramembrane serine protease, partial [Candidatus Acidoferrales bacterium]